MATLTPGVSLPNLANPFSKAPYTVLVGEYRFNPLHNGMGTGAAVSFGNAAPIPQETKYYWS